MVNYTELCTTHQIVLFDHVGAGTSDFSTYSFTKYDQLEGYVADIVEFAIELNIKKCNFERAFSWSYHETYCYLCGSYSFQTHYSCQSVTFIYYHKDFVTGFNQSEIDELFERSTIKIFEK
ncbi:hypothetical protein [Chryseobacterium sp. MP_3.2]|uniref:hypothetical protein n=1 Tax=Chryseobacterium sp. MP_3.2 TaxID=3071712 RepID=UPI002DF91869|nr:hypothetical protein [Chryseobacterium sp. MP_3.2]